MKKPWSISTTVRNADRIKPFLEVLKLMSGEVFNEDAQIKYQTLLIQHKLYTPTSLPSNLLKYYDTPENKMPDTEAKEIFAYMKSKSEELKKDPGLRGRTSVAPLSKMGLCIAKKSEGEVKITETGKAFLEERIDIGELFFRFFLKWQYPNLDSKDFKESDGFAIKPFIGALHLIYRSNKEWEKLGNKPVGLTKEEFSIFVPTLINYQDIYAQVERLIEFRKTLKGLKTKEEQENFKEEYKNNFASEFLETTNGRAIQKLLNNLKDYGDNTIRYFRLTRYLYIRGNGYYINLEARRKVEINKLLETDSAKPLEFRNLEEYRNYIVDISQPMLPWETELELKKIIKELRDNIEGYLIDLKEKKVAVPHFKFRKIEEMGKVELKSYIEELREYRRKLQEAVIHYDSQNTERIEEYIKLLRDIYSSRQRRSIELERLATLALNALNDALEIRPNYPVGDDNEPTFTAPANKPDIECFYENFNSVCEVTMLTNRSQWYNEGQPVMRHVRDFENKHSEKEVYCLFIAPRLHQDTAETFWVAVKHGYKGASQRIIPLSITQFIKLLEVLLEFKKQGRFFEHTELLNLYDKIINLTKTVKNSDEWVEKVPDTISAWGEAVLSGGE